MSVQELYKEIQSLPERERENLLMKILLEPGFYKEFERVGYLRLSERSFDFWNDSREDIYQDYANR